MKPSRKRQLGVLMAALFFTAAAAQTPSTPPAADPFRPTKAAAGPGPGGAGIATAATRPEGGGGADALASSLGAGGSSGGGISPVPDIPMVQCQWTVYSMELSAAQQLLTDFHLDSQRHDEVILSVGRGSARLEEMIVVRTRSGQRAKVESIAEKIYPTHFASPSANPAATTASATTKPSAGAGSTPGQSGAAAAATAEVLPTEFEIRNAGTTLEVEPIVGPDGITVDVTLAPEIVTLLGMDTFGDPARGIVQPRFLSRKLSTSISLKGGTTAFVGTVNPPHLSGVEGTTTEKVAWLAFLKVEVNPVK